MVKLTLCGYTIYICDHFNVIRPEMCGLISTKISVESLCEFQTSLRKFKIPFAGAV